MFGPFGLLYAHWDWLHITNMFTSIICRELLFNDLRKKVFDITLKRHNYSKLLLNSKFIILSNKKEKSIWEEYIFLKFLNRFFSISKFVLYFLLTFTPIGGSLAANQITSARRTMGYIERYFELKNKTFKEKKQFKKEHITAVLLFGSGAGFLEFIPYYPMLTIVSNTVAAARWSCDFMDKLEENENKNSIQ